MKMKLHDLIVKLQSYEQTFGPDINVDCNNMNGIYFGIKKVDYQQWTTREGKLHETVTICLTEYDESASLKGKEK